MPARKRTASSALEAETPRRSSRRISASGEKSKYFESEKEEHEEEPPKKKRGRPVGSKSKPAAVQDEEGDEPVKKGPWGHPRKAKAVADDDEDEDKPAEPVKKGPWGHPKKTKAKNAVEDEGEDDPAPVKKGRARKAKAASDETEEEEEAQVEDAPVKKGPWGHPKKTKGGKADKPAQAEEAAPKKGHPKKGKAAPAKASDDDAEPEDEDDDEDDENVRKVVILPKAQLRPEGGVAYTEEKLHKNTLLFLKDIKANNNRPWLKSNDGEYRRALKDWNAFIENLTPTIIEKDDTIPELPTKDIVYRIYRDTRFSKDPTPYKTNFSAAWSRTGRKGPYAVYYLHCEPGNSMLVGGLWCPDKDALVKLRASIDERPARWRRVLGDETLRKEFLGKEGMKGGVEGALKAFAAHSKSGALKKKPQAYAADHRDIELLKLKNFILSKKIPDDVFTSEDGQEKIADIFGAMVGFVTFLNNIVMPDPNLDDDDDDDDGGDDVGGDDDEEEQDEEDEDEEEEDEEEEE